MKAERDDLPNEAAMVAAVKELATELMADMDGKPLTPFMKDFMAADWTDVVRKFQADMSARTQSPQVASDRHASGGANHLRTLRNARQRFHFTGDSH